MTKTQRRKDIAAANQAKKARRCSIQQRSQAPPLQIHRDCLSVQEATHISQLLLSLRDKVLSSPLLWNIHMGTERWPSLLNANKTQFVLLMEPQPQSTAAAAAVPNAVQHQQAARSLLADCISRYCSIVGIPCRRVRPFFGKGTTTHGILLEQCLPNATRGSSVQDAAVALVFERPLLLKLEPIRSLALVPAGGGHQVLRQEQLLSEQALRVLCSGEYRAKVHDFVRNGTNPVNRNGTNPVVGRMRSSVAEELSAVRHAVEWRETQLVVVPSCVWLRHGGAVNDLVIACLRQQIAIFLVSDYYIFSDRADPAIVSGPVVLQGRNPGLAVQWNELTQISRSMSMQFTSTNQTVDDSSKGKLSKILADHFRKYCTNDNRVSTVETNRAHQSLKATPVATPVLPPVAPPQIQCACLSVHEEVYIFDLLRDLYNQETSAPPSLWQIDLRTDRWPCLLQASTTQLVLLMEPSGLPNCARSILADCVARYCLATGVPCRRVRPVLTKGGERSLLLHKCVTNTEKNVIFRQAVGLVFERPLLKLEDIPTLAPANLTVCETKISVQALRALCNGSARNQVYALIRKMKFHMTPRRVSRSRPIAQEVSSVGQAVEREGTRKRKYIHTPRWTGSRSIAQELSSMRSAVERGEARLVVVPGCVWLWHGDAVAALVAQGRRQQIPILLVSDYYMYGDSDQSKPAIVALYGIKSKLEEKWNAVSQIAQALWLRSDVKPAAKHIDVTLSKMLVGYFQKDRNGDNRLPVSEPVSEPVFERPSEQNQSLNSRVDASVAGGSKSKAGAAVQHQRSPEQPRTDTIATESPLANLQALERWERECDWREGSSDVELAPLPCSETPEDDQCLQPVWASSTEDTRVLQQIVAWAHTEPALESPITPLSPIAFLKPLRASWPRMLNPNSTLFVLLRTSSEEKERDMQVFASCIRNYCAKVGIPCLTLCRRKDCKTSRSLHGLFLDSMCLRVGRTFGSLREILDAGRFPTGFADSVPIGFGSSIARYQRSALLSNLVPEEYLADWFGRDWALRVIQDTFTPTKMTSSDKDEIAYVSRLVDDDRSSLVVISALVWLNYTQETILLIDKCERRKTPVLLFQDYSFGAENLPCVFSVGDGIGSTRNEKALCEIVELTTSERTRLTKQAGDSISGEAITSLLVNSQDLDEETRPGANDSAVAPMIEMESNVSRETLPSSQSSRRQAVPVEHQPQSPTVASANNLSRDSHAGTTRKRNRDEWGDALKKKRIGTEPTVEEETITRSSVSSVAEKGVDSGSPTRRLEPGEIHSGDCKVGDTIENKAHPEKQLGKLDQDIASSRCGETSTLEAMLSRPSTKSTAFEQLDQDTATSQPPRRPPEDTSFSKFLAASVARLVSVNEPSDSGITTVASSKRTRINEQPSVPPLRNHSVCLSLPEETYIFQLLRDLAVGMAVEASSLSSPLWPIYKSTSCWPNMLQAGTTQFVLLMEASGKQPSERCLLADCVSRYCLAAGIPCRRVPRQVRTEQSNLLKQCVPADGKKTSARAVGLVFERPLIKFEQVPSLLPVDRALRETKHSTLLLKALCNGRTRQQVYGLSQKGQGCVPTSCRSVTEELSMVKQDAERSKTRFIVVPGCVWLWHNEAVTDLIATCERCQIPIFLVSDYYLGGDPNPAKLTIVSLALEGIKPTLEAKWKQLLKLSQNMLRGDDLRPPVKTVGEKLSNVLANPRFHGNVKQVRVLETEAELRLHRQDLDESPRAVESDKPMVAPALSSEPRTFAPAPPRIHSDGLTSRTRTLSPEQTQSVHSSAREKDSCTMLAQKPQTEAPPLLEADPSTEGSLSINGGEAEMIPHSPTTSLSDPTRVDAVAATETKSYGESDASMQGQVAQHIYQRTHSVEANAHLDNRHLEQDGQDVPKRHSVDSMTLSAALYHQWAQAATFERLDQDAATSNSRHTPPTQAIAPGQGLLVAAATKNQRPRHVYPVVQEFEYTQGDWAIEDAEDGILL